MPYPKPIGNRQMPTGSTTSGIACATRFAQAGTLWCVTRVASDSSNSSDFSGPSDPSDSGW